MGMCGVWCVVCGVWCAVCGVWCVVCGVWCEVCGVWCVHEYRERHTSRAAQGERQREHNSSMPHLKYSRSRLLMLNNSHNRRRKSQPKGWKMCTACISVRVCACVLPQLPGGGAQHGEVGEEEGQAGLAHVLEPTERALGRCLGG